MKIIQASLVAITSLSLTACGMINGAGQDFQNWGNYLERTFEANESQNTAPYEQQQNNQELASSSSEPISLQSNTVCAQISLPPMNSKLVQFEDPASHSDATKVAEVNLTNVYSRCYQGSDAMTVSLDLSMAAQLGPKARLNANDKPYLSFPYYITVSDYQGNELAREVFAASFAFDATQMQKTMVETIEQNLPLNSQGALPHYKMEVGFELSDEQRSYNQNSRTFF